MNTCRKYLQLFWIAAVLLIAGAQFAHAYQDLACVEEHSQEYSPTQNECPAEHQCCDSHSSTFGLPTKSAAPGETSVTTIVYLNQDLAYSGGILDEIKYPPRLS